MATLLWHLLEVSRTGLDLPCDDLSEAGYIMPSDRNEPLRVRAEAADTGLTPWTWAIYQGANQFLIVRSRPEYRQRIEAPQAGFKAAGEVGQRLRAEVVLEDAASVPQEPA